MDEELIEKDDDDTEDVNPWKFVACVLAAIMMFGWGYFTGINDERKDWTSGRVVIENGRRIVNESQKTSASSAAPPTSESDGQGADLDTACSAAEEGSIGFHPKTGKMFKCDGSRFKPFKFGEAAR